MARKLEAEMTLASAGSLPERQVGWLAYKWQVMVLASVGTVMAISDMFLLNVALPTIATSFGTDLATVRWTVMAYQITAISLIVSLGRLTDIWGVKRLYVVGFLIYGRGAALSALSTSVEQLILFRALQGVGGAVHLAVAEGLITTAFPAAERGRAQGINMAVAGITATIAPAVSGLLVDLVDWRVTFYLRLPIGATGAVLAYLILKEKRKVGGGERFDLGGAVVLAASLSALMLTLSGAWAAGTVLLAVLAAGGLSLFVALERRLAYPLVRLSLFRSPVFSGGIMGRVFVTAAIGSVGLLLPFFLQQAMGYSPSQAGLLLMAMPLALAVVTPFAGWLSDRLGARSLCLLGLPPLFTMLLLLARLDSAAGPLVVIGLGALGGLGWGVYVSPLVSAVLGAVPREHIGVASSLTRGATILGPLLGTAASTAVFAGRLSYYAATGDMSAARVAAFHDAFLVPAGLVVLALPATLLLRGRRRAK